MTATRSARIRKIRAVDDLDRAIARRTAANPEYPVLVQAALDRRRLMRKLAATRERQHISQEVVAKAMKTSQPAVARMESGEADVRYSTIARYAEAVGQRIRFDLVPKRTPRMTEAAT